MHVAEYAVSESMADAAARALRSGDYPRAENLYRILTETQPGVAPHWMGLSIARRGQGDRDGELSALDEALAIEPRLLAALLLKGALLDDRGDRAGAAQAFKAALAVAPAFERLPTELKPLVMRAHANVARHRSAHEAVLRRRMGEARRGLDAAACERVDQAIEVALGKKAIYHQQPHNFYFPDLPETQFYDRDRFEWLAEIERNTEAIRAEFEAVWRADEGFTPYIDYARGVPVDQWAELNHSERWSAFHLIKNGRPVAEHAASCPNTLALLGAAPGPTLVGRSPNAMFSVLRPRTRIPPHTGDTNVRLVVHIPLIVPERTGFRVGNDVRPWRVGEALVFNDTIEHEAWNDSDQMRAVLIFDIWHPDLSETERALVAELMSANDEFAALFAN